MRIAIRETRHATLCVLFVVAAAAANGQTPSPTARPTGPTMASILAATQPADWRALDPENTLYLDFTDGRRVVIELSPVFAPAHSANVKALVREGYFDGLSINRVQDNYVVQWGDPDGDDEKNRRPIRKAKPTLPAEFDRELGADLPFTPLSDGDLYAAEVGWTSGFPAGRDPKAGRTWLTHCYGALGAARGNEADSGGGAELFVVIGHAPRHLDRNITLFGRVVHGIDALSALPRGGGALGFYEKPEQRVPIRAIRVAADVPASERTTLEVLRTDSEAFRTLIDARRHRREEWFKHSARRIELCNVPLPVRPMPTPTR